MVKDLFQQEVVNLTVINVFKNAQLLQCSKDITVSSSFVPLLTVDE